MELQVYNVVCLSWTGMRAFDLAQSGGYHGCISLLDDINMMSRTENTNLPAATAATAAAAAAADGSGVNRSSAGQQQASNQKQTTSHARRCLHIIKFPGNIFLLVTHYYHQLCKWVLTYLMYYLQVC